MSESGSRTSTAKPLEEKPALPDMLTATLQGMELHNAHTTAPRKLWGNKHALFEVIKLVAFILLYSNMKLIHKLSA